MRRPPVPRPKAAPRNALLEILRDGELYQAQIVRRSGKTERSVAYMLEAMQADGLVTSRMSEGFRYWKAHGSPYAGRIDGSRA